MRRGSRLVSILRGTRAFERAKRGQIASTLFLTLICRNIGRRANLSSSAGPVAMAAPCCEATQAIAAAADEEEETYGDPPVTVVVSGQRAPQKTIPGQEPQTPATPPPMPPIRRGGAVIPKQNKDVRSRRFEVLRCLHFTDTTRVHQTRSWVVYFWILRPFEPHRATATPRAGADHQGGEILG